MPAYYAAINNARAAAQAAASAQNGSGSGAVTASDDEGDCDPSAYHQPAISLQPLGNKSQQASTATEPVKDEAFQKTMSDISRLGLRSDPFVCGQCEATFKTYFGLRKHVTTSGHESEYHPRCFICNKYFKRAVNLRMH